MMMLIAGFISLLYGVVDSYIEQSIGILPLAVFVAGLCLLVIVFWKKGGVHFSSFDLGQFKKIVFVVTSVVCCCGLWLGINYFAYKLPWQWDVTREKQHTLSMSTVDLVKNMDKEVKLTALFVGDAPKYLEDLFKEYTKTSHGKVTGEIVDPVEQISYAAQFGNVINAQEHKVIIVSGKQRREVDFTKTSLSEEQLTNAILRVMRPMGYAYFLTGHGELNIENKEGQGLSILAQLLDSNNFSSKDLMLGVARKVPLDCSVLIIAGPKSNLTKQEDQLIKEYLKKGGRVLFLVENVIVTTLDKPLRSEELHMNPSMNEILNDWGINVEEDVVVDLANHVGEDVGSPATKNYIKHKAITEGLDYTFYVRPRSISVLNDRRSTIKLAPIVLTASSKEKSWGETNRMLQVHYDEGVDTPGPVPIAYAAWEGKQQDGLSDMRLIVFTDADFLSNEYIEQYNNAKMGLNVINWLAETDYKVLVHQKNIKVERLDLTSKQKRIVASILFLMPVFIAFVGMVVWMKGR